MSNNAAALRALPSDLAATALGAFAHAFDDIFLYAVPCVGLALIISFFLRDVPLGDSAHEIAEGESF